MAVADVPVVAYPVGRSGALGVALLLLGGAGWLTVFLWLFMISAQRWQALETGVLLVSCLTSSAALWIFWRRQIVRVLRWDGECWWLGEPDKSAEQGGDDAQAQVRLDVQRGMLLWFRARDARRGTWLWAQASSDPARWHLLRCALYLPLTSATMDAAPAVEAVRA